MYKKLKITENVFFLIENAIETVYAENDIILSVVIEGEPYFICQEPPEELHTCEIGIMFNHFCDSSNYVETAFDDLGYEYFVYQSEWEKANCVEDISRDLYEFGCYLAFSMKNMAVLFYKKANKIYCQVTQNDWKKGEYKKLCREELTDKILAEWKKTLLENPANNDED